MNTPHTPTKVMIVDDSMMVRQQVANALPCSTFAIVEACDGIEALEKLSAGDVPALMVLDVNMPGMSGIEVLQQMRARNIAGVAVVMLTSEGEPALIEQAKALGARGWIIKPFKADLLLAAVRKLTQAA